MQVDEFGLYGNFDREETLRRFPEIEDIRDDELQEQVVGAVRNAPDYLWTAPASSHHHPPKHQARHGLWLHIKRVCTTFERVSTSMVKQGHLDWSDVDMGRAACILHDMFKYGEPPTSVDSTSGSHDVTAARWLDDHTSLPQEVVGAVESHNGPWYAGKPPETHLEQMVHVADMQASDENCRVAVKDPHPVLEHAFPTVNTR